MHHRHLLQSAGVCLASAGHYPGPRLSLDPHVCVLTLAAAAWNIMTLFLKASPPFTID